MSARKQVVPVVKKQVPVVTIVFVGGEEITGPVTKSLFPHLWNLWHYGYPKMVNILLAIARTRPGLGQFRIAISYNSRGVFEATLQFKAKNSIWAASDWISILSITSFKPQLIPSPIFTIEYDEDTFCPDWKIKKINQYDIRWITDNLTRQLVLANLNGQEEEKRRAMAAVMCMFFYTGDTIFLPNKKFIAILKLL